MPKTIIVLLAVRFSAVGAIWFLYLAGYNMSVAVWAGLIALLGIDAETGVFMRFYFDLATEDAKCEGRLQSLGQLREAIVHGAAKCLRPKFMSFTTTCVRLFPIMFAMGGAIFASFVLELLVYPVIYEVWRWGSIPKSIERIRGFDSMESQPEAGSAGSRWICKTLIPPQEPPRSQ
jgi:copper/silver efflux system protein